MQVSQVDYSKKFEKDLRKAPLKIQKSFRKRLDLFLDNKFDPTLNNHSLAGKYKGTRSINITGDWRAFFREYKNGQTVYFVTLGTHSQLYK
jgi:mRNA interferase YafQ